MSANERQIGGRHYKQQQIQHWDFVISTALPYPHACAIKYLSRWRDKAGLQDLSKAKHFLDKIYDSLSYFKGDLEKYGEYVAALSLTGARMYAAYDLGLKASLADYLHANGIASKEAGIMRDIVASAYNDNLYEAMSLIHAAKCTTTELIRTETPNFNEDKCNKHRAYVGMGYMDKDTGEPDENYTNQG